MSKCAVPLSCLNCSLYVFRLIEAAYVAGEDEVSLSNAGKSFVVNLASLHEIRLVPFNYIHDFLLLTSNVINEVWIVIMRICVEFRWIVVAYHSKWLFVWGDGPGTWQNHWRHPCWCLRFETEKWKVENQEVWRLWIETGCQRVEDYLSIFYVPLFTIFTL